MSALLGLMVFMSHLCYFPTEAALTEGETTFLSRLVQQQDSGPKCTLVLLDSDPETANLVAMLSVLPMLIINSRMLNDSFRDSARKSECVLLLALGDQLEEEKIEALLRHTRQRTIVLLRSGLLSPPENTYLREDYVLVRSLAAGSLLLSKACSIPNGKSVLSMIWNGDDLSFFDYRRSCSATLRGKTVTVAIRPISPYVIYLPNKKYVGTEVEVFQLLSKAAGFSYRVREETAWIEKSKVTNKWIGIAGSIINGSAQFGYSIMDINRPEDSSTFPVDFSPEIYEMELNLLTPKEKPITTFMNFLRPFSLSVWLLTLGTGLACSVTAYILVYFHDPKPLSFWRIIYDLNGTLWCQNLRDTLVSPNSSIFFVIFGFWIIGIFFKGAAYNCNLRAVIVKKDFGKPVETDDDLVRLGMGLYLPDGSVDANNYQRSMSLNKRILYARAVERHQLYSFQGSISSADEHRQVQEGAARLIVKMRTSLALQLAEARFGYQPFRASKTVVLARANGFVMQMYQPWQEEVALVLMQILAGGIVDRLFVKYVPVNKYSYPTDENEEEKLEPYRVEHIMGALIVLAIGLLVSIVGVGLELLEDRQRVGARTLEWLLQQRVMKKMSEAVSVQQFNV